MSVLSWLPPARGMLILSAPCSRKIRRPTLTSETTWAERHCMRQACHCSSSFPHEQSLLYKFCTFPCTCALQHARQLEGPRRLRPSIAFAPPGTRCGRAGRERAVGTVQGSRRRAWHVRAFASHTVAQDICEGQGARVLLAVVVGIDAPPSHATIVVFVRKS